jgi:hypothetical protein
LPARNALRALIEQIESADYHDGQGRRLIDVDAVMEAVALVRTDVDA